MRQAMLITAVRSDCACIEESCALVRTWGARLLLASDTDDWWLYVFVCFLGLLGWTWNTNPKRCQLTNNIPQVRAKTCVREKSSLGLGWNPLGNRVQLHPSRPRRGHTCLSTPIGARLVNKCRCRSKGSRIWN